MAQDKRNRSISTLFRDLVTTAELTGVSYSEETLRRVLKTFENGFLKHSIQLRSTTKPAERRDLCFRFLDLDTREHPFDRAVDHGELAPTEHPIFSWLPEVAQRFSPLGFGVDFEAVRGLVKIWQFIDGAYDPEALLSLPAMPRCFRPSLPLLHKLGLDSATIVGADFVNASINLYFRPSRPSHSTGELVTAACKQLGFREPSIAAQAHAARAGCIGVTYGWVSPAIERICFYVPGFTRQDVPAHEPLLSRFAADAPAIVDAPNFIVGWSHGSQGTYLKIEDDYTGDVSDVFGAAMAVEKIELDEAPGWAPPPSDTSPNSQPNRHS